jgi:hypothetical protein
MIHDILLMIGVPPTANVPANVLGRVVVGAELRFSVEMIVYSRLPMLRSKVKFLVDKEIPSIHSRIRLQSGEAVEGMRSIQDRRCRRSILSNATHLENGGTIEHAQVIAAHDETL